MPWKNATRVELSEKQERILIGYATGTHTPMHLKTRAQIVLKAARGWSNNSIEKDMGLDDKAVKRWRDRSQKPLANSPKVSVFFRSGINAPFLISEWQ